VKRDLVFMKRKALAFILIVVFAVSAAAWLVYTKVSELQNQISELQAQNDELQDQIGELQNQNTALQDKLDKIYEGPVQITEFKLIGRWNAPGGVLAAIGFNLTIHNLENRDVNGLTVEVRVLNANGSEIQAKTMWDLGPGIYETDPFDVGVLHAEEVRTLTGGIWSDWNTLDNAWTLGPITAVATIKLGNAALDEAEVTY
jgi:opacity protein-like surface antigen